jgi:hypothetical protein
MDKSSADVLFSRLSNAAHAMRIEAVQLLRKTVVGLGSTDLAVRLVLGLGSTDLRIGPEARI